MNLTQLPYCIAIATAGNLSAAAKQVGISEPALSSYLKKLEQETGMALFFRSGRKYIPTPAGRVYLQAAQQILELQQHTKRSVASLDAANLETLRLGISPNRGMEAIAAIFPDFDKRYPQVKLTLQEGYTNQLQTLLLHNHIDGMLATQGRQVPAGVQVLPFQQDELVLAVPSFYPTVQHRTFLLEELPFADLHDYQQEVFVMPEPTAALYGMIQATFAAADFTPRVATASPNMAMQEAMIRSGRKIGLLASHYIRPNDEIAFFRLKNAAKLTMVYMTRSGHHFSEAERCLLYLLIKRELRSSPTTILWNDFLKRIMWEFDPVEALEQQLEAPDEHQNS